MAKTPRSRALSASTKALHRKPHKPKHVRGAPRNVVGGHVSSHLPASHQLSGVFSKPQKIG
jgi:hypothetical protein